MKHNIYFKPNRTINEDQNLYGLTLNDLTFLGLSIVVNQKLFSEKYSFFPLLFMLLALFILIPIRQNFRQKIIRDSVLFYLLPKKVKL